VEVIDDFQRRLPVVIQEPAVIAQHAELQRKAAAMIRAAGMGNFREILGAQSPVSRQTVFADIGRRGAAPTR